MPLWRTFTRDLATPVIWRYGFMLLLGHAVCVAYLIWSGTIFLLQRSSDAICWPFFESCWRFHGQTQLGLVLLVGGYLAMIGAATVCAALRRFEAQWVLTLACALILTAIVCLDYRLRQNQYYMFLWVNVTFLFAARKGPALELVIVSFYFWAGTLKLNHEWMSGADLYRPLWPVPPAWTPAACVYVVVLEVALVFGLLARNAIVFWATLAQLAAFHVMSLTQINWFYPVIMGLILTLFVLRRLADPEEEPAWPRSVGAYGFALAFSLCQLAPHAYAGDKVLNGQGRFWALHMFESRQVCQVDFVTRAADGTLAVRPVVQRGLPPRLQCDPVIYYGLARNMCRQLPPNTTDLDWFMSARRWTERDLTAIVRAEHFCSSIEEYKSLSSNDWFVN